MRFSRHHAGGLAVGRLRFENTSRPGPLARMRAFNADQVELWERWLLMSRPWEEEWLHWGSDGALHGSLPPPKAPGRRSITASGWCPGLRMHGN